jgi:hypothetical protein
MLFKRISILIFVFILCVSTLPAQEEDPYLISLGSASLRPHPGKIEVASFKHFIIQFLEIPSENQVEKLSEAGVKLQRYIGGNAYIALAKNKDTSASILPFLGNIRTTVSISEAMRIAPDFSMNPDLQRAIRQGLAIPIDVRFHPDVDFERAKGVLTEAGIVCSRERFLAGRRLIVEGSWPSIQKLQTVDEIDTIEPALLNYKLLTLTGTKRLQVDKVFRKARFRKPDGSGVLAGITDAWVVDKNHVELAGRVTVLHDTDYMEKPTDWSHLNHATSVAGNLASGGVENPQTQGAAPAARILSMVMPYDPVGEIRWAAQNLNLRISSNSWSYDPDLEILPPVRTQSQQSSLKTVLKTRLGYYPNFNFAMDAMVRKADVLHFWAAGNEASTVILGSYPDEMNVWRDTDAWHRKYPQYDTITINSSAKNVLAIGAAHKDDVICQFSSRGPGYNGRIGPHLVATGFEMLTLASDDTYGRGSGTSGSCPLAAGVAALLIDQYRKIHQSEPSSALIKAILINSARDLGPEGPDYTYGFGMVDAQLAARTVSGQESVREANKVLSRFVENRLKHKEQHVYTFRVPKNMKELRVTLVWHDPPGPKLINNLDLWVSRGKNERIRPLTLNPNIPTAPAVPKRNTRDNTEHVLIQNPQAGDWSVVVNGKKIPKGRQAYALVIAAGRGNEAPVLKANGNFLIHSVMPSKGNAALPQYTFRIGDPIYLHAQIEVLDNAFYPEALSGYYGTVSARFELRDESGTLSYVLSTSWSNMAPTNPGEYRDLHWRQEEIPEGLKTGNFRVRTIVTMHNGITKVAPEEYIITLQ